MAITTILLLIGLVICCGGALYNPLIGIIGYILHYHISPDTQWWGASISHLGIRYSFLLVIFTGIGTILNRERLRYGNNLLVRHEWLFILFVAIVWLSLFVGLPIDRNPAGIVDPPEIKMLKLLIVVFLMTHIVTTIKQFNLFLLTIVLGVLFVGYQTYTAPSWSFASGRLEFIGGPDFREANGLAAHFAASLPLIAVYFVRSGWLGRILATVTGVLAINGMVLTRSRGGFVALAGCMLIAGLTAPKKIRRAVFVGLLVVAIGGFALTDPYFWKRAETITASEIQRDTSAQSRFDIWVASLKMLVDHPLGVGTGNFPDSIYFYLSQQWKKDAHNTYVLCYSELGLQGIIVYGLLIFSAIRLLRRVRKEAQDLPPEPRKALLYMSYSVMVSLSAFLFSGLTMSRLYSEGPTWVLVALPVCLWRALENARLDANQSHGSTEGKSSENS